MNDWLPHLMRPQALWLLLAAICALWLMTKLKGKQSAWRHYIDPALQPYVLSSTRIGKQERWPWLVAAIGWLLGIFALAGPAWDHIEVPAARSESAWVIVLDLSQSMNSVDVKPSRLTRARLKVVDILQRHQDGQNGLVAFAGEAFTVTPITDDIRTIESLNRSLSPDLLPTQGSNLAAGIERASTLLQQAGMNRGNIIVLTDSSASAQAREAAQNAAAAGFRTSVLGIGTTDGAPVPLPQGGWLKDAKGGIVIPGLNRSSLQELALAGAGVYSDLTSDDRDLNRLLDPASVTTDVAEPIDELSGSETARRSNQLWRDRGPWLVLCLLPLAALAFRRGWLGQMIALPLGLALLGNSPEAIAFEWQDLWQRTDQQAHERFQAGDSRGAAEIFEQADWRGTAQYRAGDHQAAAESFDSLQSPTAHYNRANALAQTGDLEAAIAAYDQALKANPDLEDAQHNREVLQSFLDQQQSSEQQQNDQSSDSEQSENSESSDSSENSSPSEQQSSDSEQNSEQNSQDNSQSESPDAEDQNRANNTEENEQPSSQEAPQNQAQEPDDQDEEAQQAQSSTSEQEQDGAEEQNQQGLAQPTSADDIADAEQQRALQQWLNRVPDDPGGLLRRKFARESQRRRQSNQRAGHAPSSGDAW